MKRYIAILLCMAVGGGGGGGRPRCGLPAHAGEGGCGWQGYRPFN